MQLGLDLREPEVAFAELGESLVSPPSFVVELPPATAVFLRNLKDLLWTAEPPPLRLASKPGQFWPDVDFAGMAGGQVGGILSVDISDWFFLASSDS